MRLDLATPDAVYDAALAMRGSDFREFRALSTADSRPDLACQLTERFGSRPDVMVAFDGDEPVAVGGLLEQRPNVLTVLFFATDRFPVVARPLTRFVKQELLPRVKTAGAHRIECVVQAEHATAIRWIRYFGLRAEGLPMRGYGKSGETFQQFAWVSGACPAGA